MKRLLFTVSIMFLMFLGLNGVAFSIPVLQLDVLDGTYELETETIISPGAPFTLYALLTPNGDENCGKATTEELLNTIYYLSVAITPKQTNQGALNLGNFAIDGPDKFRNATNTNIDGVYDVTSDMFYGIPPYEDLIAKDGGDLGSHGIFETYFREFAFQFNPLDTVPTYNTQDAAKTPDPSDGIDLTKTGDTFYVSFDLDTIGLDADYNLHFDLYSTYIKKINDVDILFFAPFSHDAESSPVPEPFSVVLFSVGVIGLAASKKKSKGPNGRKFLQA